MPESSGPADKQRTAQLKTAMAQLSNVMERLVAETMDSLSARGIDPAELAPLLELRQTIRALHGVVEPASEHPPGSGRPSPAPSGIEEKRSESSVASEALLARASAAIDVLVQSGYTPEHAAQLMTRRLLAMGVVLPQSGGDARAWKRLFTWRENLIHRKRSGPAWDAYLSFRQELAEIPPDERLRRVTGERIWDLRNRDHASRNAARS